MISKSNDNRTNNARRAGRTILTAVPSLLLALLGSGCAERYELGAISQEIDDGETGTAPWKLHVIAATPEDGDAVLPRSTIPVGDVDQDGYDDWMSDGQIGYGRPRPATDGVPSIEADGPRLKGWTPVGDINGDGHPDFAATSGVFQLGGPDRSPGDREVTDVASFGDREAIVSRFRNELTNLELALAVDANSVLTTTPLGDIDADGYDDLALVGSLSWSNPDTQEHHLESVTHIYYGGPERATVGFRPEPDARLRGVDGIQALGDLNGDGYGDVRTMSSGYRWPDHGPMHIVRGSAQRLTDEVSLDDVGVQIIDTRFIWPPATPLGDIDRDGYDDLLLLGELDDITFTRHRLFYGSPTLLDNPLEANAADAVIEVAGPTTPFMGVLDWNGDGFRDILVASSRVANGLVAQLLPGSPARYSGFHHVPLIHQDARYPALSRVYPIGDIDGDGLGDILFGASFSSTQRANYVKYGGPLEITSPIH
jgi:hypothetical protein